MTRVILLLFCTIYLSQCNLQPLQINLDGCKEATACYVRESCIDGGSNINVLADFKDGKLTTGKCDVIIQIRFVTDQKYQVIMQVDYTGSSETIDKSGVSLKQDVDQFSCTKTKIIVNSALFKTPVDPMIVYNDKLVHCSFVLELTKKISSSFLKNNKMPSLHFKTISAQIIEYTKARDAFWNKPAAAYCDPDKLASSDSSSDGYIAHKINTASYAPLTCGPDKSLIITHPSKSPISLDIGHSLHCVDNMWKYLETSIPSTENIKVACGSKVCSLCTTPLVLECPGCSKPSPPVDNNEKCKIATCPNNQWKTEDGKVLTSEMECKQEIGNANSKDAFWYLQDGTNSIKVTKAACFDKGVCWADAKFNETCPFKNCQPLKKTDTEGTELTCPEGFPMSGGSTKLKCDFATGRYKDENGQLINPSDIYCAEKEESPSPAGFSKEILIYGGIGAAVFLLVLVVIICVICRMRNRKRSKKAQQTIYIGGESQERGTDRFSVRDETSLKPSLVFVPPKPPPKPPTNSKLPALPSGPKTPWLMRNRKKNQLKLAEDIWKEFTEDRFQEEVLPAYANISAKARREVFYIVTGMDAYSLKKENKKAYGHIRHFFELLKVCELHQLDDVIIWEKFWRFVRMLSDVVNKPKHYKDTNNLCPRMKSIMVKIARPIFNELGWTMADNEDPKDTRMRFFVVRVLMWAEECDVIAELTRLSSLPLNEVQAPLRPVVIAFAVRNLGKGAEIKHKYWKTVLEDPKNPAWDRFGTFRQHILYGLASKTSGNEQEMNVTKETLAALYDHSNMATSFSPFDIYWAWMGATDYSTKPAIELFILTTKSFTAEDAMYDQIHAKYPSLTEEQLTPYRYQWKDAIVETVELLAECTSNKDQYYEHLLRYLTPFDFSLEVGVLQLRGHDSIYFEARTTNIDGFNKELKRDNIFNDALKRIEE